MEIALDAGPFAMSSTDAMLVKQTSAAPWTPTSKHSKAKFSITSKALILRYSAALQEVWKGFP